MIDITFNKELGIIITECAGVLNLKMALDYFENMKESINTKDHLFVLLDSTHARINIDPRKELRLLFIMLCEETINYRQVYLAFVVNQPYETVLALLFKEMSIDISRISIEIFSTRKVAERRLTNLSKSVMASND